MLRLRSENLGALKGFELFWLRVIGARGEGFLKKGFRKDSNTQCFGFRA